MILFTVLEYIFCERFTVFFVVYEIEGFGYFVGIVYVFAVLEELFELFVLVVCGGFLLGFY